MTISKDSVKQGARIFYNDGRAGHVNVGASVLSVDTVGMVVQFDDRADTTRIKFTDKGWMQFLSVTQ